MDRLSYTNETLLADKNEVLDLNFLRPIGEIITKLEKGESVIGMFGAKKISSWYEDFKVMYGYPDSYNIKTDSQKKRIKEIGNKKNNSDIMNLVEIAIGRLLENYYSKKHDNVRVRKTSVGDDYLGSIDYIIEYKDNKGKVKSAVGVDLTVIESIDEYELERRLTEKKKKKYTKPMDYLKYISGTNKGYMKEVPRIILHFNKDVAYHFTNNYFADIFERGKILTEDEIKNNLDYAIDDYNDFRLINMKSGFDINKINYKILDLINKSKKSSNNIINKQRKNVNK